MIARASQASRATTLLFLVFTAALLPAPAAAESDWSAVAEAIGRPGSEGGGVYRVPFPRSDLHVTIDGTPIKTGLALGGWAAFAHDGDSTVVTATSSCCRRRSTPSSRRSRRTASRSRPCTTT